MAKNEIKKEIYRSYKKNAGTYLAMSVSCLVIFLLVVTIDYWLTGSIIITFPFLVIPFFIGMVISMIKIEAGEEWSGGEFYRFCRVGFHSQFRRSLRVFNSFLKSLLRFLMIVGFFAVIIVIFRNFFLDPELAKIISLPTYREQIEALNIYLHDINSPYVVGYTILYCFAFVLSFVNFMERLSDNTMMLFLTLNIALPHNQIVIIHKEVKKIIKKDYNRLYYSLTWPVTILFTAGFALGAFLAIKTFQNMDLVIRLGMIIGLIFTLPYYPIAVLAIHRIFNTFSGLYYNESKEALEKAIKQLLENPYISPEQKKILHGVLCKQISGIFGEKVDDFDSYKIEYFFLIEEINKKYSLEGIIKSINRLEQGIINDIYLVETDTKKYILRKLNKNVFCEYSSLINNAFVVSEYLINQKKKQGFASPKCLEIIKSNKGDLYIEIKGEHYYLLNYIIDSFTLASTDDLEIVKEAGRIVGQFQKDTQQFDIQQIKNNLPYFHDTEKRYEKLLNTVKVNQGERVELAKLPLDYLVSMEHFYSLVNVGLQQGETTLRVIHGDTKLNNILFEENTHKGICLVDFDTIMLGSILYDFGDAVRDIANTASQEDKNLAKAKYSLEHFAAFTEGFLSQTYELLTDFEIKNLYNSVIIITLELAIRFLEDYIGGNQYFKVNYSNENFVRALGQIEFAKLLVENKDISEQYLAEIVKKYKK